MHRVVTIFDDRGATLSAELIFQDTKLQQHVPGKEHGLLTKSGEHRPCRIALTIPLTTMVKAMCRGRP